MSKIKKAVLVYQAGIANVFSVKSFNMTDYGREAIRIVQGDFHTCESIAYGLKCAGVKVMSATCNMAGDIVGQPWSDNLSDNLEDAPFSDKFHPVSNR